MRGARRCRRPWSHTNVRGIDERYRSRPDGGRCVTRENEDVARNASLACTLPLRRVARDRLQTPAGPRCHERCTQSVAPKTMLPFLACRALVAVAKRSARHGFPSGVEIVSVPYGGKFQTTKKENCRPRERWRMLQTTVWCRRRNGADDGMVQTGADDRTVADGEKKKTRRCRRRAVAFQS